MKKITLTLLSGTALSLVCILLMFAPAVNYSTYHSASMFAFAFGDGVTAVGGVSAIFALFLLATLFILIALRCAHEEETQTVKALSALGAILMIIGSILSFCVKSFVCTMAAQQSGVSYNDIMSQVDLGVAPIFMGILGIIGAILAFVGGFYDFGDALVGDTTTRIDVAPSPSNDANIKAARQLAEEGGSITESYSYDNQTEQLREVEQPVTPAEPVAPITHVSTTPIEENKKAPVAEEKSVTETKERIELLREYKKLLDEGILTQEEFDAKKKELLGL